MAVVINKNLCPQDHECPAVKYCPEQALSQNGNMAPKIDSKKCIECGTCVSVCPKGALHFE